MKADPSHDKLRGGYYTPTAIAEFLSNWAIRTPADRVLEPSCGDGAMCEPALRRLVGLAAHADAPGGELVGLELHASEAEKARSRTKAIRPAQVKVEILATDFFDRAQAWGAGEPLFAQAQAFDAIIGNPPFIRYQDFADEHRQIAIRLMRAAGLNPNRLMNAWVPFLVVSALLLKPAGRLAMVIPAELLQVSYAAEIRRFLSDYFEAITLVTFRELVFGSIQQNVVLILAERQAASFSGIRVVELDSAQDLTSLKAGLPSDRTNELDHTTEKWTRYFLSAKQLHLIRRLEADERLRPLGAYASVDVGIVTGENDFFVVNDATAQELGIGDSMRPLVSRTAQLPGVMLGEDDWSAARDKQARVLLFSPSDVDAAMLPRNVRKYIEHGERLGVHKGYKCRIRRRWYVVPSQWVPDAFALRQVHDFPRIVLNRAGATATDTIHRVRFTNGLSPEHLAASFVNSLTLAFGEITGRSYGGGVLTFEPSEVEKLPVPVHDMDRLDVEVVDAKLREGDSHQVLESTDRVLLMGGLGLSKSDVELLRQAWSTLRDIRQTRGKRREDPHKEASASPGCALSSTA
jgi:adenine-specific DNA-methyltransferase